jgi:hypothetical protein
MVALITQRSVVQIPPRNQTHKVTGNWALAATVQNCPIRGTAPQFLFFIEWRPVDSQAFLRGVAQLAGWPCAQMATRSKKSRRRSPVSYLLTNACLTPIDLANRSCVRSRCFLSSRRASSRILRSRCLLLARCANPDIECQHRYPIWNTPKWIAGF